MQTTNISETLFAQYSSQAPCEAYMYDAHNDGHLDGGVGGRHTDEHADRG